ncbi:Alpha-N-acetylglucosaminidase [Nymphon striatum]|nr:Alpha-N-acetylglucosaminidase [Nymphon striatum]
MVQIGSSSTSQGRHLNNIRPQANSEIQEAAVRGLISRLIPAKQGSIKVSINPQLSSKFKDVFTVTSNGNILRISANSGVAASWGLHHYLKYFCNCHVSWSGDQLKLPEIWPKVNLTIQSNDRFRYYQNVCTASYSMVWWKWSRWEREIDWMALNGINLPLAFNGQEEIFKRTYLKLGLNQTHLDEYFTGPAFLAWGRMGNVQSWGGPLPMNWHVQQVALQHKILARMRQFGMTPVLPGFSGHIPPGMKKKFPTANITHFSGWGNFNKSYGTYFLEPIDPLFLKVATIFTKELISEYGTDHIYNIDLYNELPPPSSSLDYLSKTSEAVYTSLISTDPKAIWLTQGWMFFSDFSFWKSAQAKAFLTAVPQGRMLILDLAAEVYPQYPRFNSFYGQPFIWCMLHNYGGVLGMYGMIDNVNKGPFVARKFPNTSMVGTGISPEGINQNYVMYDFMNEMSWRSQPMDLDKWFVEYNNRRYGFNSSKIDKAWKLLKGSVYNCTTHLRDHGKYIMVKRPDLRKQPLTWYNVNDVFAVWKLFVRSNNTNAVETFRYDLVDVTRQSLQIIFAAKYKQMMASYRAKSLHDLQVQSGELLDVLVDLETILATNKHFLLGTWVQSARSMSDDVKEQDFYEMNAKNQISLWGPDGQIMDYAVKQWSGVAIDTGLHVRPNLFSDIYISAISGQDGGYSLTLLISSVKSGKNFPSKFYRAKVFNEAEKPFSLNMKHYPYFNTRYYYLF